MSADCARSEWRATGESAYRIKAIRDVLARVGSSLARVLEAMWTGVQRTAQHILERFAKRSFPIAESRASCGQGRVGSRGRGASSTTGATIRGPRSKGEGSVNVGQRRRQR